MKLLQKKQAAQCIKSREKKEEIIEQTVISRETITKTKIIGESKSIKKRDAKYLRKNSIRDVETKTKHKKKRKTFKRNKK